MVPASSQARHVGRPVAYTETRRFLRGEGAYLDDLPCPGAHHVAFVRSPHARARILRVDCGAARTAPGVVAVLDAAAVAGRLGPIRAPVGLDGYQAPPRPVLPADEARFVGEVVAAVLARTPEAAADAAERVSVEYEPVPAVSDMESALRPDSPRVHASVPGNLMFQAIQRFGDVDGVFAAADVVIRGRFYTGRVTAVPLEPRGCLAVPDRGRRELILWASAQAPHIYRSVVAECLGMREAQLRVRVPDIGGGFGIKIHIYPEDALVAFLASTLGLPVKWVQRRTEDLQADAHCREQIYELELAARGTGAFLGLRARIVTDTGAWALPPQGAILQGLGAARVLPGPYRFDAYACDIHVVATNKAPAGAYRGVAQPACIFAMERMVDLAAARLGLDPADLRGRNLIRPEEIGQVSVNGSDYENASFQGSLEAALKHVGYADFRARQRAGELPDLGIGVSLYAEITGLGSLGWRMRGVSLIAGFDSAHVRMMPDGTVNVASSVPALGQGHEIALAQVVADQLGVALDAVRVERADTAATPYGTGAFASRGAIAGAASALLAAQRVAGKLRRIGGLLLECAPEDVVLADGVAHPLGLPTRAVSMTEIARAGHGLSSQPLGDLEPGLEATAVYDPPPMTFANGCQVAVVRVDRDTGRVRILRYVVAHDCGRVINPLMVENQIQGGVAQGIGTALHEALLYDGAGQFLTATLMDYPLPRADEVPAVEMVHLESPSPSTLHGFKGVGENGIIGVPAALANAIADAAPEVASQVVELPLTGDRIWAWLSAAAPRPT
ncbi:MAG: xanthine dehydrogenase family protein [Candidatus Rokubacteria bacterium]|nr:xanthine dehydrogenase family protein [Candidatus Rokubacteria bacterium]